MTTPPVLLNERVFAGGGGGGAALLSSLFCTVTGSATPEAAGGAAAAATSEEEEEEKKEEEEEDGASALVAEPSATTPGVAVVDGLASTIAAVVDVDDDASVLPEPESMAGKGSATFATACDNRQRRDRDGARGHDRPAEADEHATANHGNDGTASMGL